MEEGSALEPQQQLKPFSLKKVVWLATGIEKVLRRLVSSPPVRGVREPKVCVFRP